MTKKPKDKVVDIDAGDSENELTAAEYVEDMYNYYKLTEVCISARTLLCFWHFQESNLLTWLVVRAMVEFTTTWNRNERSTRK